MHYLHEDEEIATKQYTGTGRCPPHFSVRMIRLRGLLQGPHWWTQDPQWGLLLGQPVDQFLSLSLKGASAQEVPGHAKIIEIPTFSSL